MQTASAKRFFRADNDAFAGLFLFLAVLLVFFPAIFNGFTTYDDPEYVTANPYVQSGLTLESLGWAFRVHGANWHPLTWWSHILDGQLYGLAPWGHHLDSVLLHALNTVLVFRLLGKLTGKRGRGFVVALLFGLHPLRVESVAWVAERKDVLSTCFWMLTLLAYTAYARQAELPAPNHKRKYYASALGLFALGLLSKSMLVTLPATLLLLDFWPLARWRTRAPWRLGLEKVPFFLLAAGMSLIAYFAQYHGTAMVSVLPLAARIENALVSYCRYLGKLFWPENLCAIYPYPPAWPAATVWAAALLLAAITAFALIQLKKRPYLAMGWFWFLGTLVPVIGLVQIGNQSMADRYTYIPSLGILIMVVWGVAELTKSPKHSRIEPLNQREYLARVQNSGRRFLLPPFLRNRRRGGLGRGGAHARTSHSLAPSEGERAGVRGFPFPVHGKRKSLKTLFSVTTIAVACACVVVTDKQIGYWKDSGAMYQRAVEVTKDNTLALVGLGTCLADRGYWEDAIARYRQAIQIAPNYYESHYNLGLALMENGRLDEAIAEFHTAMKCRPGVAASNLSLGVTLTRKGDTAGANAQFEEAATLDPANVLAHANLGKNFLGEGNFSPAVREFQAAVNLSPYDSALHYDLATALLGLRQFDDAISEYRTALKFAPGNAEIHNDLGTALGIKGDLDAAIPEFQAAVKLNPLNSQAAANLAKALKMAVRLPPAGNGGPKPPNR